LQQWSVTVNIGQSVVDVIFYKTDQAYMYRPTAATALQVAE